MSKYYTFKINVGPDILKLYRHNMDQLRSFVIPNALGEVFTFEEIESKEIMKYVSSKQHSKTDILDSAVYKKFISLTKKLELEYRKVAEEYENTGRVVYEPDFLKSADDANQALKQLQQDFIELDGAKNISNDDVDEGLLFRVGTGVRCLQGSRKVKLFLKDMSDESQNKQNMFYYDKRNEYIYLSTDLGENQVLRQVKVIEETVNHSAYRLNIGEITINPVSDSVRISGNYSSLTLVYSYPNGREKDADDRDAALSLKKTGAIRKEEKFIMPADEKFPNEIINDITGGMSSDGYLKDIKHGKKSIVKWMIKISELVIPGVIDDKK
ncbi:hypothetical protein [Eupransor demetentiae]|uniref:Uncharacterized protein n=1 Tax=Eupransor demetentiae TaxID=3109584 RepID=A0ABM9N5S2_9LACO|nr:hypothetical protein R54876_GBNLAHCA_01130 [Lactobacillaceae bacterium LMG 33000]